MSDIFDGFPQLVPLRDDETLARLQQAAAADSHGVVLPTHVMMKNNELAGYFSIGALAHIPCWFSTKQLKVRDSLSMINSACNIVAASGAPVVSFHVQETSPFFRYMERMGFQDNGAGHIFIKNLRK